MCILILCHLCLEWIFDKIHMCLRVCFMFLLLLLLLLLQEVSLLVCCKKSREPWIIVLLFVDPAADVIVRQFYTTTSAVVDLKQKCSYCTWISEKPLLLLIALHACHATIFFSFHATLEKRSLVPATTRVLQEGRGTTSRTQTDFLHN